MENIEQKISRHDKKFRFKTKLPVCKIQWSKGYVFKTDFAYMGSVLLGAYNKREEFYLKPTEKFQVWLAVPNAYKYVSTEKAAIKLVEESYIFFNDKDIEMSRITKSKAEWDEQYESDRARGSISRVGHLTLFDSGEFIDVYHERMQIKFEIFKKNHKEFKMINYKTGNKTGFIGYSKCESDEPVKDVSKLIERIYPKRDYLGRHILKGGQIEKNKICFIIDCVASKDFEEKLKFGLELIMKKYNLNYIFEIMSVD